MGTPTTHTFHTNMHDQMVQIHPQFELLGLRPRLADGADPEQRSQFIECLNMGARHVAGHVKKATSGVSKNGGSPKWIKMDGL